MARDDPQLKLRLTADMKDQVVKAAIDSGRSVNAEIVARLEQSFQARDWEIAVAELQKVVESQKSTIDLQEELIAALRDTATNRNAAYEATRTFANAMVNAITSSANGDNSALEALQRIALEQDLYIHGPEKAREGDDKK